MRIWLFLSAFLVIVELQAQTIQKKWRFFDANNRTEHFFSQGNHVVISWTGSQRTIHTSCVLEDIQIDSVCISIKKHNFRIAKQDILKIRHQKRSLTRRIVGSLSIVLGIFVIGFAFLVQAISNAGRTDYQLARGEKSNYWPWAFLGVGIVAGGIILLIPKPFGIKNPFDSDQTNFEVFEKHQKPGNQFP